MVPVDDSSLGIVLSMYSAPLYGIPLSSCPVSIFSTTQRLTTERLVWVSGFFWSAQRDGTDQKVGSVLMPFAIRCSQLLERVK